MGKIPSWNTVMESWGGLCWDSPRTRALSFPLPWNRSCLFTQKEWLPLTTPLSVLPWSWTASAASETLWDRDVWGQPPETPSTSKPGYLGMQVGLGARCYWCRSRFLTSWWLNKVLVLLVNSQNQTAAPARGSSLPLPLVPSCRWECLFFLPGSPVSGEGIEQEWSFRNFLCPNKSKAPDNMEEGKTLNF